MEQMEYSDMLKSQLGLDIEFEKPKEIDIENSSMFGNKGGKDANNKKN